MPFRNPDGDIGVWCATVDGPWGEACNVPFCTPSELLETGSPAQEAQKQTPKSEEALRHDVIKWVGASAPDGDIFECSKCEFEI